MMIKCYIYSHVQNLLSSVTLTVAKPCVNVSLFRGRNLNLSTTITHRLRRKSFVMSVPTNAEKYVFDQTGAVTQIGSLSTEKVVRLGGPMHLANKIQGSAIKTEKKRHDSEVPPGSLVDPLSRRRARNRKSTNSNSRGRRRHTMAMKELNSTVITQIHALSRTEEVLDKQLEMYKM